MNSKVKEGELDVATPWCMNASSPRAAFATTFLDLSLTAAGHETSFRHTCTELRSVALCMAQASTKDEQLPQESTLR